MDTDTELTITLRKPVTFGGETYTTLSVSEPTAAQLMGWEALGDSAAGNIKAVAIVSGLPEPAIKMIGVRDLLSAARFIAQFSRAPEGAGDQDPPAQLVLTLRKPIAHGETTVTELKLAEPIAGDLLDWDQATGVAADCKLIAAVSGVPEVAVRQMGARDIVAAADYLANFLVPGLTAGARS